MGLFDQIASAIDNPDLQANAAQLGNIFTSLQNAGGSQGIDANTTQAIFSAVASQVRGALQTTQANQGIEGASAIVDRFGSGGMSAEAVSALFPAEQQQQMIQAIAQRTGVSAQTIESLLPTLVPAVLNLLNMGSPTQSAQAQPGQNPLLSGFLDADGDGDVDMGDAMQLAGQFLNQS